MKILVTGAAGFIGSHLSERLKQEGHEVFGIDSLDPYYSTDFKKNTIANLRDKGIEVTHLDLAEDSIARLVDGVEVVYHVAAQPGNSSAISLERFTRNNLFATHQLLNAVENSTTLKSFVNVATSSVYGFYATSSEDEVPKPVSNYGVTKLAAEQLVLSWYRNKGFPACSLRLFSVFGPRERPDKLYPKLVKSIAKGEEFPLFEGSFEHQRSFTYIDDAISGFMSVLPNWDKACGEVFNIGTDTCITTKDGIEIVENIMGEKARFNVIPKRWGDQVATHANIDKARELLGYSPETVPVEGLKKFVSWYQSEIHDKVPYEM